MGRNSKIFTVLLFAVLLSAGTLVPAAAQIPPKPVPPRTVNDYAGIFTVRQRAYMEDMLSAFADSTSNQITVVTVNDLEGMEPAMYAYEIGETWGVGSSRFDNGIVVLVKPKTSASSGQVYIAVGYGLEGAIPDATAKLIVENEMIPRFRQNDYAGGVAAALTILMKLASGEISYKEYENSSDSAPAIFFIIVFIVAALLLISARSRGRGTDIDSRGVRGSSVADAIFWGSILGGGRHGGGSGGFGGGSGFGGFGGGSFGGGGAGGSW